MRLDVFGSLRYRGNSARAGARLELEKNDVLPGYPAKQHPGRHARNGGWRDMSPFAERREAVEVALTRVWNDTPPGSALERAAQKLREVIVLAPGSNANDVWPRWRLESITQSADVPNQVSWARDDGAGYDEAPRLRAKWGKFLARLNRELALGIAPDVLARLAEMLGAHDWPGTAARYEMRVVSGADLAATYDAAKFGSCMVGCKGASDAINLYAENPQTVSILRAERNGALAGRALLWNVTDVATGVAHRFLDRIYPNNGPHVAAMLDYARERGWDVRANQGQVGGPESGRTYQATVRDVGAWPWIDTLYWGTDCRGEIILSNGGGDYEIRTTDNEDPRAALCADCGDRVPDDTYYSPAGEIICEECRDENYAVCDRCQGTFYHDDVCESTDGATICDGCAQRSYTLCGDCERYCPDADRELTASGAAVCPECAEAYGQCDACGELHWPDDMRQTADGAEACPECLERDYVPSVALGAYLPRSGAAYSAANDDWYWACDVDWCARERDYRPHSETVWSAALGCYIGKRNAHWCDVRADWFFVPDMARGADGACYDVPTESYTVRAVARGEEVRSC